MRYKVVVCPRCLRPAITYAEKSYRCRVCGRTSSMAKLYEDGLVVAITEDYEKAREVYRGVVERGIRRS